MVNAEKHKQIRNIGGMLPLEDKDKMHKIIVFMLQNVIENPQNVLNELDGVNDELNQYYDGISEKHYNVLKIGTCKRILEIYENVFLLKDCVQRYSEPLKLDSDVVKSILNSCNNVLNSFKDIQTRQNKNIDKTYCGLNGIKEFDSINNADYPKESFESIVRLQEPIFVGADSVV